MEIRQQHTAFILHEGDTDLYNLNPTQFRQKNNDLVIRDEDTIKDLYPDTSVEVTSFIFERLFKIDGDFVIMKYNILKKHRNKNKKFFSKRFSSNYLKINTKTGNFLAVVSSGSSRKRRVSSIKTNSFHSLIDFLYGNDTPFFTFDSIVSAYLPESEKDNVKHKFNNEMILIQMPTMFSTYKNFMDFFIDRKRIKVPDFIDGNFLKQFYPTEKYLKKNDRKMVQSILDMFGVNSKYSVKLFHKYGKNFNLSLFVFLHKNLGGSSNLSNINDKIFYFKNNSVYYNKSNIKNNMTYAQLSEKEKSNVVKVINSIDFDKISPDTFISELKDHFLMLNNIREYTPLFTINATNYRTFSIEHSELSKLNRRIQKGYELFFEFDGEMLQDIETPISDGGLTFYPYVLKTDSDYREEGEKMNHCVYNYHDANSSIIISVRNGDGSDRVTCEFSSKTGELLQAKHFNNRQPPKEFESVIYRDLVMNCHHWSKKGKLKRLNVIKKPITINGVTIETKSPSHLQLPF